MNEKLKDIGDKLRKIENKKSEIYQNLNAVPKNKSGVVFKAYIDYFIMLKKELEILDDISLKLIEEKKKIEKK